MGLGHSWAGTEGNEGVSIDLELAGFDIRELNSLLRTTNEAEDDAPPLPESQRAIDKVASSLKEFGWPARMPGKYIFVLV